MAPFALSVPGYRLGVHSHRQRHHKTSQQHDAGAHPPSPSADSDTETQFSSITASATTSRLPSEAINPLSHSPDTLRQLAVAGLSPEDELPSRLHPGFPHRPLPPSRKSRGGKTAPSRRGVSSDGNDGASGAETDSNSTIASRRQRRANGSSSSSSSKIDAAHHSARVRHLSTMTAIMHRCLREGDIPRAKRALGLLLRTRDVDLRVDNLWTIGSEILMRDGEVDVRELARSARRRRFSGVSASSSSSSFSDSDSDVAEAGGIEGEGGRRGGGGSSKQQQGQQRWGSAANMAQVRAYLETLIQHHPYDAHRPQLTNAVDFWPALFGIEVYNLDAEFRSSLEHIYAEYGHPSTSTSFSRSPSPSFEREGEREQHYNDYDYGVDKMDIDDDEDFSGGRRNSLPPEEDEDRDRHAATDALRSETQRAALALAARMDGVLENPPYNTHAELLRLRGHVALFVADLFLPSRLMERFAKREDKSPSQPQQQQQGRSSLRDADGRLRKCARHSDEHIALARRRDEQGRAVAFFRRARAARGRLEEWVLRVLDEEGDEEEGGGPVGW